MYQRAVYTTHLNEHHVQLIDKSLFAHEGCLIRGQLDNQSDGVVADTLSRKKKDRLAYATTAPHNIHGNCASVRLPWHCSVGKSFHLVWTSFSRMARAKNYSRVRYKSIEYREQCHITHPNASPSSLCRSLPWSATPLSCPEWRRLVSRHQGVLGTASRLVGLPGAVEIPMRYKGDMQGINDKERVRWSVIGNNNQSGIVCAWTRSRVTVAATCFCVRASSFQFPRE
jgi:hypothetical protein